jgi:hypothetical protein
MTYLLVAYIVLLPDDASRTAENDTGDYERYTYDVEERMFYYEALTTG